MEKRNIVKSIGKSLSLYYHEPNAILNTIVDVMKIIGSINVIDEVRKAYKNGLTNNIVTYEGEEDNYPIVQIHYDSVKNIVLVEYYIGDVYDDDSWNCTEDNYSADELRYLSEDERVNILKYIKNFLEIQDNFASTNKN